jgi:hypothetical protein
MRLTILLLFGTVSVARGQASLVSAARNEIGHLVRVTDFSGASTIGELRDVRADALTIAPTPTTPRHIDFSAVAQFDVRMALDPATRHKRGWFGAVAGLALGAGAGYLVAVPRVRATERDGDGAPLQQVEYVVDPAIGGLLGAVVGWLVGSWPHERWYAGYRAPAT